MAALYTVLGTDGEANEVFVGRLFGVYYAFVRRHGYITTLLNTVDTIPEASVESFQAHFGCKTQEEAEQRANAWIVRNSQCMAERALQIAEGW